MMSLCNDIIKPNFQKFRPEDRKVVETMKTFGANRPQAEAIVSAVNQKSGFVLIQGPPGTGKTKTIMSLIGSILTKAAGNMISLPGTTGKPPSNFKDVPKKTKLLCCAPSNAACDEIIRRMKQGILNANGQKFVPNIVRLGQSDSIHSDVKDVTLELLVEENFTTGQDYQKFVKKGTFVDEAEKELKKRLDVLNKERDDLRRENQDPLSLTVSSSVSPSATQATQQSPNVSTNVANKDSTNVTTRDSTKDSLNDNNNSVMQMAGRDIKLKVNNEKRKEILEKLTLGRIKRTENSKALDFAKKAARQRVLNDADVVCCTLSSAGHEIMSHVNIEFNVVIIDEACQSIELSSLIPLKYGAKKCILVGDPNQLPPTVLSQMGQKFEYEQSLFQRIMKNVPDTVHLLRFFTSFSRVF